MACSGRGATIGGGSSGLPYKEGTATRVQRLATVGLVGAQVNFPIKREPIKRELQLLELHRRGITAAASAPPPRRRWKGYSPAPRPARPPARRARPRSAPRPPPPTP